MAVTAQQVIDSQVHLGALKSESHPKTSQYWKEVTNGLVVFDPEWETCTSKKRRKRNPYRLWKENVCTRFRRICKKRRIFIS